MRAIRLVGDERRHLAFACLLLSILWPSLTFGQPIAGNNVPGSAAYPDANLHDYRSLALEPTEENLSCVLVDEAAGFAYCAAGKIIKVRLSDNTRVATLRLSPDETGTGAGVIDPAAGFAYFVVADGHKIVKVRLSDFTRAGELSLPDTSYKISCATIDAGRGYAYFGTSTGPGTPSPMLQVLLSDFSLAKVLTVNSVKHISAAAVDSSGGFVCFGTSTQPAVVVRVRAADFSVDSTRSLPVEDRSIQTAVINPSSHIVYFGMNTGCVVKFNLSSMSRVGAMNLSSQIANLYSSAIDASNEYAYFGGYDGVVRVKLSDSSFAGKISAPGVHFMAGAVDSTGGNAYFGGVDVSNIYLRRSSLAKIRLSDFTKTATISFNRGDYNPNAGVIDTAGGYAYFGTDTVPGNVVKVRLSDFTRAGSLALLAGENNIHAAAIDANGGHAYFCTETYPARIVKVRLSDFSRVGALTLAEDEVSVSGGVTDSNGYGYFVVYKNSPRVVKVRLSDLTRVGTVALAANEQSPDHAIMDPAGGNLYICAGASLVVKIRLSDFTRAGAAAIGGMNRITSAFMDPAGGYAYFGNSELHKVRLSDFKTVGTAAVASNGGSAVDPVNGCAYLGEIFVGSSNQPWCFVHKVRLKDMTIQGRYDAPGSNNFDVELIDPNAGFLYGVNDGIVRMAVSFKNSVHANQVAIQHRSAIRDVRFYSHALGGHVRLAIYDNASPRKLVWQSWPTYLGAAESWIVAPVEKGIPGSVTLNPGTYWLAWQTDSAADVPGYAAGAPGIEFTLSQPYSPFPASVTPVESGSTASSWSIYMTTDYNAAAKWMVYE